MILYRIDNYFYITWIKKLLEPNRFFMINNNDLYMINLWKIRITLFKGGI